MGGTCGRMEWDGQNRKTTSESSGGVDRRDGRLMGKGETKGECKAY